jgi:hypothetical protein
MAGRGQTVSGLAQSLPLHRLIKLNAYCSHLVTHDQA